MTTYIAMLRGINVGGHRSLKMKELREMFALMGFENVSTYIQSGNVVFDTPEPNETELASQIKDQITSTFGYDVPVIICSVARLQKTLDQIPFQKREGWKRYITFLSDQPSKEAQEKLVNQSSEIERFKIGDRAVYIHLNKETDKKPNFSGSFIERQLKVSATNRNLRSVRKILALAFPSQ